MSDAMTLGFMNIGSILDMQNDDDRIKSTMWNLPSTLSSSTSGLSSALESDQGYECGSLESGILYTPPLLSMGDPFATSTASPAPLSLPTLLDASTDSSKSRSVLSQLIDIMQRRVSAPSLPNRSSADCKMAVNAAPHEKRRSRSLEICKKKKRKTWKTPKLQFSLTTHRWKKIAMSDAFQCPIVEIRPYNKADGKRYVYMQIDGVDESKVRVRVRLQGAQNGQIYGYLKHRVNDECTDLTLAEHMTLFVSEDIVRRLDERGIGRGCPLQPDHGLQLVVIQLVEDGSDGPELCSIPFYRIKRRQKRRRANSPVSSGNERDKESEPVKRDPPSTTVKSRPRCEAREKVEWPKWLSLSSSMTPEMLKNRADAMDFENFVEQIQNEFEYDIDSTGRREAIDSFFHPNIRGDDDHDATTQVC